jgi:hypothetical protein
MRITCGATLSAMPSKDADDEIEVRCPECGAVVRVAVAEAERTNKAKCPNGHEVPLAKALG